MHFVDRKALAGACIQLGPWFGRVVTPKELPCAGVALA